MLRMPQNGRRENVPECAIARENAKQTHFAQNATLPMQ
jgi:hypothetical protein